MGVQKQWLKAYKKIKHEQIFLEILMQASVICSFAFMIYSLLSKDFVKIFANTYSLIFYLLLAYWWRYYMKELAAVIIGGIVFCVLPAVFGANITEKIVSTVIVAGIMLYSCTIWWHKDNDKYAERVSPYCVIVFCLEYFMLWTTGITDIVLVIVIHTLVFVVAQVRYNSVMNLKQIYEENENNTHFQGQRMLSVQNKVTAFVTMGLLIFGFICANAILENALMAVLLKLLYPVMSFFYLFSKLFAAGGGYKIYDPEMTTVETEEYETVTTMAVTVIEETETTLAENIEEISRAGSGFMALKSVALVLAIFTIIVLAGFCIYAIIKTINSYKKIKSNDTDTIVYIKHKTKREKEAENNNAENELAKTNIRLRQFYMKKIRMGIDKTAQKTKLVPYDLTKRAITKDAAYAKDITDLYEKARYSDIAITEQEIDTLKSIVDTIEKEKANQ